MALCLHGNIVLHPSRNWCDFLNIQLTMGAECKGAPLPLDIGQCMRYASEVSYGLEITGTKSKSCLLDQSADEEGDFRSVEAIKAEIQKYEGHLRSMGHNIKDNGEKLKIKLMKLKKKLEEMEKQQASGASNLEKEAEQYSTKADNKLTYKRSNGLSSAAFSCTIKQIAGHEQCKPAFDEAFEILKGAYNNGNTKMGVTQGSNRAHMPPESLRSRGQKGNSSTVVPSSSFYRSSRNISQDSEMDLENGKRPTKVGFSIASRVSSGKRHRTLSSLQKESNPSLRASSPGFAKGLRKDTSDEPASSQRSRLFPELHMQRDSLGASLDTAMELSDDEEKRGADDGNMSTHQKDLSTHPYSLRRTNERREGFKMTYPSGDPEAVEVQQADMKHLNPYEFLNDTVIDFYIKYLQRPEFLSQEKRALFHFFNTFFFKKLLLEKRKRKKGNAYYSKLRKWTKGVNIFEKKYLLVPVHDCAHWSLAMVCFALNHQKGNGLTPYILHLDSMREGHPSEEVFQVLCRYLEAEWNYMRGLDESCTTVIKDFVCKRVEVPLQQNAWDCGLFLLYFIECFLRDAGEIFEPCLLESMFGRQWFKPQEASNLRKRIRSILENLIQELNDEIMMEDMD